MSTAPNDRTKILRRLILMVAPALFVAGCGHREDEVPRPGLGPDLREVAKTRGKRLEFKADRAGKLYLYDYDTGDFLVSVPVNAGDTFVLEPASNRALLGKQPVDLENPANAFDDYRLYFADNK